MIHRLGQQIGFLEQASYSAGRYAFWVISPIIYPTDWGLIAALSMLSLLAMTLYSSIIGGPSFFKLVRGQPEVARESYLLCNVTLAALAAISFVAFIGLSPAVLEGESGTFVVLAIFSWASIAADWARKVNILLGQRNLQLVRNFAFLVCWSIYVALHTMGIFQGGAIEGVLVFSLLSAATYLPLKGTFAGQSWSTEAVLSPFSVWKHYLLAGLAAYGIGNMLFWFYFGTKELTDFLILRNYMNLVLVLALYIESYGPIALHKNPGQPWPAFYRYVGLTGALSVGCALITHIIMSTNGSDANIDPAILGIVAAVTFFVAAIKFPTVYLRLVKREKLVSAIYLCLIPIWPLLFLFDTLPELPYRGLEVLGGQYVVLFTILMWFAFRRTETAKNSSPD